MTVDASTLAWRARSIRHSPPAGSDGHRGDVTDALFGRQHKVAVIVEDRRIDHRFEQLREFHRTHDDVTCFARVGHVVCAMAFDHGPEVAYGVSQFRTGLRESRVRKFAHMLDRFRLSGSQKLPSIFFYTVYTIPHSPYTTLRACTLLLENPEVMSCHRVVLTRDPWPHPKRRTTNEPAAG